MKVKKCKTCNQLFIPQYSNSRYCSSFCKDEGKKHYIRICVCGKVIPNNMKYCSPECRKLAKTDSELPKKKKKKKSEIDRKLRYAESIGKSYADLQAAESAYLFAGVTVPEEIVHHEKEIL